MDEEIIRKLEPYHIWNESFVDLRLHWKKQQPIHVLALKVYRLQVPSLVNDPLQYAGCKSWLELPVDLPDESELTGPKWVEAISTSELNDKIDSIQQLLNNV